MPKRLRSSSSSSAGGDTDALTAKQPAANPSPRSPPCSGCSLPLTHTNVGALSSHNPRYWKLQSTSNSASASSVSAGESSAASESPMKKKWDKQSKLAAYEIDVDTTHPWPQALQRHIEQELFKQIPGTRSPNAKKIVDLRRPAALENEPGANRLLEPLLLFSNSPLAVPGIASKPNHNLDRQFLPNAPSKIIETEYGLLTQPQPDTATGYLSPTEAGKYTPRLATAFTKEEQAMLRHFTLNPGLLFPLLTSQWKPANGEAHQVAMCQTARDGAAVVNYLHDYYQIAYNRPATVVEALHVSVTCNVEIVNIWLHWREDDGAGQPKHYMKSIHACTTWTEPPLLEARAILKNLVRYALDERVASIKAALPHFYNNKLKMKGPGSRLKANTGRGSAASIRPPTPMSTPFSPPPQVRQSMPPQKKRRPAEERVESEDELQV